MTLEAFAEVAVAVRRMEEMMRSGVAEMSPRSLQVTGVQIVPSTSGSQRNVQNMNLERLADVAVAVKRMEEKKSSGIDEIPARSLPVAAVDSMPSAGGIQSRVRTMSYATGRAIVVVVKPIESRSSSGIDEVSARSLPVAAVDSMPSAGGIQSRVRDMSYATGRATVVVVKAIESRSSSGVAEMSPRSLQVTGVQIVPSTSGSQRNVQNMNLERLADVAVAVKRMEEKKSSGVAEMSPRSLQVTGVQIVPSTSGSQRNVQNMNLERLADVAVAVKRMEEKKSSGLGELSAQSLHVAAVDSMPSTSGMQYRLERMSPSATGTGTAVGVKPIQSRSSSGLGELSAQSLHVAAVDSMPSTSGMQCRLESMSPSATGTGTAVEVKPIESTSSSALGELSAESLQVVAVDSMPSTSGMHYRLESMSSSARGTGTAVAVKPSESRSSSESEAPVCVKCQMVFANRDVLNRHNIRNHKSSKYKCRFCRYGDQNQENILQHEKRRHKDQTLNMCIECNKNFRTYGELQIHLIIHSGEKPYSCNVCQKSFTTPGNVSRHLRTVHLKARDFLCRFCGKSYVNRRNVKLHENKEHIGQLVTIDMALSSRNQNMADD